MTLQTSEAGGCAPPPGADPRRVLVPDADTRAALAAIRNLGRHGCRVYAGTKAGGCLGARSSFSTEVISHPDPANDPAGFVAAIAGACRSLGIGAIFPGADVPANVLIEHRDAIPHGVHLLVPPQESLRVAHDKIRLAQVAAGLGVGVPRGIAVSSREQLESATRDIGFPLILKPRVSRALVNGRWIGFTVRRIRSAQELEPALEAQSGMLEAGVLVQEVVEGEGRGVFVLARDGDISCCFSHQRIREKPPGGGVSTLCEAAEPEPELLADSVALMRELRWTGVAMVEFKWDPATRRRWLMEINGRLWGSVRLAISAGVEFPWLFYRQAVLGERIEPGSVKLRTDVRLWWLLGDVDHFLLRLRERGFGEIRPALADLVSTRQRRKLVIDTWSARDPRPFLFECGQWLRGIARIRRT
jgi:predicted ATP-grasp superfamily ATP-dependent carboligase